MEEALRNLMLSPAFYPHHPEGVKEVQTHISHVFIAPPFVYKVKKPVDFGFLNFSSLASRCFYSHQELTLNSRFSPDLYLEVLPITFDGTTYHLDGPGEQVEYALKMRQFDERKTMKRLIERGELTRQHVETLASHLAGLHERVPSVDPASRWGTHASVTFDCEENFEQLTPFVGNFIDEKIFTKVKQGTIGFLRKHKPLFAFRHREGFVKECHGDLHTEHIIFDGDDIHIFDCIEFNKRFRFIDTISDLSFLVMELDFLELSSLNAPLLQAYFSRVKDTWGPLLIDFYACYRATVRSKVHAFTAGDPAVSPEQKARSEELSQRYLTLAQRLIARYDRPYLVITMGFSGTGKSTVARSLGTASGLEVLRTDTIRKEIARSLPSRQAGEWNAGLYTTEARARVYEALFERAREALAKGRSVCLDASFLESGQREQALALARESQANLLAIECVCEEKAVREYLNQRQKGGKDASDADFSIYLKQKEAFSGWGPIPAHRRFTMDTTRGISEETISMLSAFLKDESS